MAFLVVVDAILRFMNKTEEANDSFLFLEEFLFSLHSTLIDDARSLKPPIFSNVCRKIDIKY